MAGVVLVHGAWHGAWCWGPVVEALERRGVEVAAVELPLSGFLDDVRVAREAAGAMGPDTVLVGHSYGGLVISEAAVDLPSVSRLVYVTAFMSEAGEDATAILTDYGSAVMEAVEITDAGVIVDADAAPALFYGDSDRWVGAAYAARLRPMPLEPLVQRSEPAWTSTPSTYVVCTNDRVLPPEAQRWMASRADEIVEIHTDHSPFMTQPDVLADLVVAHLP
jgi:pimeloyl-ACP methyl ester carboxylesterase